MNISWELKRKWNNIQNEKQKQQCIYIQMCCLGPAPSKCLSHQNGFLTTAVHIDPQKISFQLPQHEVVPFTTAAVSSGSRNRGDVRWPQQGVAGGPAEQCLGGWDRRAERMGGQETENTRRTELRERRVWLTRIQLNRENGTGVTLGGIVWPTLCRQWAASYVILLLRIPSCVFSGKLLNLSVPQVFSSVKSE